MTRFKILVTPALAKSERKSADFHRLSDADACPIKQLEAVKACEIADFQVWLAWAKATPEINPGLYKELMNKLLYSGKLKALSPSARELAYRLCDRKMPHKQSPTDCYDILSTQAVASQLKKLSGLVYEDYLPHDRSMVIDLINTTTPKDLIMSILDIDKSLSKDVEYLRVLIPNINNEHY